jgi:hypothetical protein
MRDAGFSPGADLSRPPGLGLTLRQTQNRSEQIGLMLDFVLFEPQANNRTARVQKLPVEEIAVIDGDECRLARFAQERRNFSVRNLPVWAAIANAHLCARIPRSDFTDDFIVTDLTIKNDQAFPISSRQSNQRYRGAGQAAFLLNATDNC